MLSFKITGLKYKNASHIKFIFMAKNHSLCVYVGGGDTGNLK